MKHLLFFSFCLFLLFSCRDRREYLLPDSGTHIRFNDMQIGQTSRYVLFKGEAYFEANNFNFTYLPDTLVLAIIGADANGYLVEEKLTPGSASLHGANHIYNADSVYRYYLAIENDTVRQKAVPGQSFWIPNHLTDNRAMALDGPGSWYAYSAENGIVKTASYSWWTQEGLGWDLLPD